SDSATIEAISASDPAIVARATIAIGLPPDQGPCFRTIIQPLFISHCGTTGCHNPNDRIANFELTTWNGLLKAVSPGDTSKSLLWYRSQHVSKLSADKLQNIGAWIMKGARNTQCVEVPPYDTTDI